MGIKCVRLLLGKDVTVRPKGANYVQAGVHRVLLDVPFDAAALTCVSGGAKDAAQAVIQSY